MIKVSYFAKKGCFTAGRDGAFFDEEAAVAELVKGGFGDKCMCIKGLFEIGEGAQKGQKWGEKGLKSGGKEKFSFGRFCPFKPSKGGVSA